MLIKNFDKFQKNQNNLFVYFIFLKIFFYLVLDRGEGRERKIKVWLPLM